MPSTSRPTPVTRTDGSTSTPILNDMRSCQLAEPEVNLGQQANQWSGTNDTGGLNEGCHAPFTVARTHLELDTADESFIAMAHLTVGKIIVTGDTQCSHPTSGSLPGGRVRHVLWFSSVAGRAATGESRRCQSPATASPPTHR